MGENKIGIYKSILIAFMSAVILCACTPDVACPTGHIDAKSLSAGNGKTEKKRTDNGLIKVKKSNKNKKRR